MGAEIVEFDLRNYDPVCISDSEPDEGIALNIVNEIMGRPFSPSLLLISSKGQGLNVH